MKDWRQPNPATIHPIAGYASLIYVEPYAIVVGNPARQVKRRFDDDLISLLEKLRWWDRAVDEINRLIPLLTSGDLEMVRRELQKLI